MTSILLYEENIITVRCLTRGCDSLSSGRAFQHWHSVPRPSGGGSAPGSRVCGTAERLRGTTSGLRSGAAGGGSSACARIRIQPAVLPALSVSPVLQPRLLAP